MDATHLDTFVDALIDDLAVAPVPEHDADRGLFHLLDCPRRVLDEPPLLAVLVAAVTARNLLDHVIAQTVAAAERLGIPARKHLRSGVDLLTSCGVAPGAAYRSARVGRAAHTLPALTRAQRLGGVGIEFADAVGKGVTHINNRVALSEEERAEVVTKLMIQTTPSQVAQKARAIAIDKAATQPEDDQSVPVAENADLNEMTVVVTEEGRVAATFDVDALTGEELLTALDPLCRPIPLPDGSPDPRPAGKRRADACGSAGADLPVALTASDERWGAPARHPDPARRGRVRRHPRFHRTGQRRHRGPDHLRQHPRDGHRRRQRGTAGCRARRATVHPRYPKRVGRT
ncbi:DUF222 domain-containing protein [Mycolicibacterium sp. P9-22]|uniref:DUF222 domain-containing protein n=1 Tax=Mycolicibacterium sp. P9-22 TaxID=2024613 RepID=UPI001D15BDB4|nr:DUF222 domain-containing protein [Mycolicibacterium sp. P9-22]